MSFGLLDPLRRNIGVRLSLWYALIFTLSSLALFGCSPITCWPRPSAAKTARCWRPGSKKQPRSMMPAASGALRNWVRSQPAQVQETMFVRLVNIFNNVALLSAPKDWVTFRDVPGWQGYRRQVVLRIPQNAERDFTLASGETDRRLAAAGRPHHQQPRGAAGPRPPQLPLRRHCDCIARLPCRGVLRPSRHAAGPPDRRDRPLDHPHRQARCARARPRIGR